LTLPNVEKRMRRVNYQTHFILIKKQITSRAEAMICEYGPRWEKNGRVKGCTVGRMEYYQTTLSASVFNWIAT
jgi:hypothetical protein